MKKMEKIDFINEVYKRIMEAPNHGGNNNWWYPQSGVIAYNVKMHKWPDIETLRGYLSKLQNDHYNDDDLDSYINWELENECIVLKDDIMEIFGLESWFAGRSGGWIEVEFPTVEEADPDNEYLTIDEQYKQAKKIDKLADNVENFIVERHKSLHKYIDTPEYYQDIAGALLNDQDIKNEYQQRIKDLTNKINL